MKRLIMLVAVLFFSMTAYSQDESDTDDDLMDLDLGALLDMEVTSVSKKAEPLFRASSAIFVITADDIKKMGATNIPEALRAAPGVQVQRLNAYGYQITIRGFNTLFSNKLLVMVDGRTVYTPSFSGVHWDMLDVNMADIAQIEVIRGPGATLWGANAVNGIINIITKPSTDTTGGKLTLGGGNNETQASLRYGWQLSDSVTATLYSRGKEYQDFRKTKTKDIDDSWKMQQSGLRLDWSINDGESLTLQGDFFKSTFGNLGVSGSDNRERSGENVVLSYNKNHDDGSNTSAKVFYNMYENIEGGTFLGFSEDVETVDFDIQHRWTTGSHEITVGGGYRTTSAAYDELYTPPGLGSLPALVLDDGVYKFSNLYVQDKITVVEDRFYLTAGLKAEYNNFTDFEAMPSLRAVYSPDEKQTFWASVSRAVRTPSFFENDSDILFGISEPPTYTFKGNDKAQSENLTAYELGYRVKPAENIILDFTAFYYDYEDIISYEIAFAPPFNSGIVKNDAKAEVYGAELAAKWIASEDLIIQMAYSYASMKLEVPGSSSEINYGFGNTLTPGSQGVLASDDNLPKHMANLRASYSLTEKLILSGAVYYMAENENNEISSWTRVDVGLIYQAMDNLEISIHAANLTDNYREESNDQFANDAQQTRRSVFVNASYSF